MGERERQRTEHSDLTEATSAIWKTNAAFWDDRMGEGASFQRLLVGFTLDGLEEPAFTEPDLDARPLEWTQFTSIPLVLAACTGGAPASSLIAAIESAPVATRERAWLSGESAAHSGARR